MDGGLIVVICIFSVVGFCGSLILLSEWEKKNLKKAQEMNGQSGAYHPQGPAQHPGYPQGPAQHHVQPQQNWYSHHVQPPPQPPAPQHGWFHHGSVQPPPQPPATQHGWWHNGPVHAPPAHPEVPTAHPVPNSAQDAKPQTGVPTFGRA